MSEERLNEAQTAFAAALASLRLKPSSLDRGRVMYRAGQASVRGTKARLRSSLAGWLWPLATAASLLLAVTLGGVLLVSVRPQTIERVVYVRVDRPHDSTGRRDSLPTASAESPASPLRADYLALRRLVLTRGVDAWPVLHGTASPEAEPLTPGDAHGRSIDLGHSG